MSLVIPEIEVPVRVFVRQRPLNATELAEEHGEKTVQFSSPSTILMTTGHVSKKYEFERVFEATASQAEVFDVVAKPLIADVIGGYSCAIFAYGKSGTGKTHTISGELKGEKINMSQDISVGLIPRAAHDLFSELSKLNFETKYIVKAAFAGMYGEEVRDLLEDNLLLRIYDEPLNVPGYRLRDLLGKITVTNVRHVSELLEAGYQVHEQAIASFGIQKSLCHTIFVISVDVREEVVEETDTIKAGRLYFVDLGGGENGGMVEVGKVTEVLSQKDEEVSNSDCKLTSILRGILAANTKTTIIATVSPGVSSWHETLITLELANPAKELTTVIHVNARKCLGESDLRKELYNEMTRILNQRIVLLQLHKENLMVIYLVTDEYATLTKRLENNGQPFQEEQSGRMDVPGEQSIITRASLRAQHITQQLSKLLRELMEMSEFVEAKVKATDKVTAEMANLATDMYFHHRASHELLNTLTQKYEEGVHARSAPNNQSRNCQLRLLQLLLSLKNQIVTVKRESRADIHRLKTRSWIVSETIREVLPVLQLFLVMKSKKLEQMSEMIRKRQDIIVELRRLLPATNSVNTSEERTTTDDSVKVEAMDVDTEGED